MYDINICPYFCKNSNRIFSCEEEHEAWHVLFIQAEVTFKEYITYLLNYNF